MRNLLSVLLILIWYSVPAQQRVKWAAPEPVAGKIYGNLHPRIALDKYSIPMVIWGNVDGKLWFTKDSDGVFATPLALNPESSRIFADSWAGPSIVSLGNKVYVVYQCEQLGDKMAKSQHSDTLDPNSLITQNCNHIFIKHSYDGGKTFSIAEQVDKRPHTIPRLPSLGVDEDGNPIVAYLVSDSNNANTQISVARSYDMGETFSHDTVILDLVKNTISDCVAPAVTSLGDNAAVVYRSNVVYLRNIWAEISTNKGYSFSDNIRMDSLNFVSVSCPASPPSCMINGDTLYSVFMSGEDNAAIVFLSMVSISNASYPVYTALYPASGSRQNFPEITHIGYTTAISWIQYNAGINQLCVAFTDSINSGLPHEVDTIAEGNITDAHIVMSHGSIYVVWEDATKGCVMMEAGTYVNKNKAPDAILNPVIVKPSSTENHFTINVNHIESILATDAQGRKSEVDFINTENECKLNAEDLEPGTYKLELIDKNGKKYHAEITVK